jgi:S-DNA-T family DNA segregation ATPase FtsK/SpoIIIE
MARIQSVEIFNQNNEERLYNLLKSFGIKTEFVRREEKRFFDIYDIKLASGVRSSKLDRVLVDIGMAMSSHSHPRGYPVMKDGVYRMEIQTREIKSPSFSSIRSSFSSKEYAPLALGSDSLGADFIVDLNKIPNLLVGGTTGSGKSVLLHSFILSLLSSGASLYLIDPKMVEFGVYEDYDAVKSIVNSAEESVDLIDNVRSIMEKRFSMLKKSGCRNVVEYNLRNAETDRLNPVVIVVDEWADIVLQKKDIQKSLCFIAQKGRAAGISIILATQRPSASVVSGLIKANFPGRIALKVASAVDSRVILDKNGAENITDVGVGLYLDGSLSKPKMFRAPFIVDAKKELDIISPARNKKISFWNRFIF